MDVVVPFFLSFFLLFRSGRRIGRSLSCSATSAVRAGAALPFSPGPVRGCRASGNGWPVRPAPGRIGAPVAVVADAYAPFADRDRRVGGRGGPLRPFDCLQRPLSGPGAHHTLQMPAFTLNRVEFLAYPSHVGPGRFERFFRRGRPAFRPAPPVSCSPGGSWVRPARAGSRPASSSAMRFGRFIVPLYSYASRICR